MEGGGLSGVQDDVENVGDTWDLEVGWPDRVGEVPPVGELAVEGCAGCGGSDCLLVGLEEDEGEEEGEEKKIAKKHWGYYKLIDLVGFKDKMRARKKKNGL